LWGVGPATARRLAELGIKSVADVRGCPASLLSHKLGRYGEVLVRLSWGDDPRSVESSRTPKSRGSETTFQHDVSDLSALCETLHGLCEGVTAELAGLDLRARTVTLKLRYADFKTITRSRTHDLPFGPGEELYRAARELLFAATEPALRPIRLIGISASSFANPGEPQQLPLPF
jgi:DNA polymerase-4